MAPHKILVVDDQPINVQLLKRKLEREGLVVLTAYNGHEALELVARDLPDLILLDVMMPDMDGIEVCQHLQASEAYKTIPVIFITARSSKEGKLEGLGVGAVDYITKPIDLDETLARVQTQLRVVTINREMVDLQRRLQEARRAATIGAVTQGIAHNLNNLLGVALGYLDLIKAHYDKSDQVAKNAGNVETALQRIVFLIRQLSTLVVNARLPMVQYPLDALLESTVARYRQDYKNEDPVTLANPLADLGLDTHMEVFEEIIGKVLINAWESYGTESFQGPRPVELETSLLDLKGDPTIQILVHDRGLGITDEVRDHLFEPFVSSKHTVGVGMGLTVARHALRNMGGDLNLEDRSGGGTTAILHHPLHKKARRPARV